MGEPSIRIAAPADIDANRGRNADGAGVTGGAGVDRMRYAFGGSLAATDKSVPEAPAEYRRPPDWRPNRFPLSLAELSAKHSEDMMARAREVFRRVDAVNAAGPWKATGESMDRHVCPEWFLDAKFGVFIDWGLWSLASFCPIPPWESPRLYPDWYELRATPGSYAEEGYPGYREYHDRNWGPDFWRDDFIPLFQARKFDAERLCGVFKACGAKYVVPFSKHHSGFSLWDSSFTFRNSARRGPRRDLAREWTDACRANGLRFGFYFSLGEWEYPMLRDDGSVDMLMWGQKREPWTPEMELRASGKIAVKDYFKDYSVPQAIEFIDKYDPDILWYDYDWVNYATVLHTYDINAYFYNRNEGRKEVAVNDRQGNGTPEELAGHFTAEHPREWLRTVRGDFFTDELGDTSDCISPERYHPWECNRGISRSFGNHWMDDASNVLSKNEFLCEFCDIVARGGNLLLLVNLDGQGAIPEVQERRLREIGAWLEVYGEAVYGTRVLAPYSTPEVDYTRRKDGSARYAVVKRPERQVRLQLVPEGGRAFEIRDIAGGDSLPFRVEGDGVVVTLPDALAARDEPLALRIVG